MSVLSSITDRRVLGALAAAAIAVSAAPGVAHASPGSHHHAPAGSRHIQAIHLSSAEQSKIGKGSSAVNASRGPQGRGFQSIFCDPVLRDPRGFYFDRCHVVDVSAGGYSDWYEYDYWTGRTWAFWFNANG